MKLSMLPFKKIASSPIKTLRILMFLILLNFLFTISIVNAINSKIISNNPSSILNPLSPVVHPIKPRGVTITINHKQPISHNHEGGKGNGKDNNANNAKNNNNPKDQKHPKAHNNPKDQKHPKNHNNPKHPKHQKHPKVPKVPNDPDNDDGLNKTKDNPNDNGKTKTPDQPASAPQAPGSAPPAPAPAPSTSAPPVPAPPAPAPSAPAPIPVPNPAPNPTNPTDPTNPSSPSPSIPSMDNYLIMHYDDIYPDLHIHSAMSYPDGPIILRLSRNTSNNSSCFDSTLFLRLVYDNVTVNYINFTFEIPDYNFCIYGGSDLIRIFPLNIVLDQGLNKGFFLVSYLQKTDGELYQENGLIVDWDGQVHR
jgi:hypothetical protein